MDRHLLKRKSKRSDPWIPFPGAWVVFRLVPFLLLAGCSSAVLATNPPTLTPSESPSTPTLTSPVPVEETSTLASLVTLSVTPVGMQDTPVTPTITLSPQPSLTPTYDSAAWESLPIIPPISEAVRTIYKLGMKNHNNPRAFSKVGDCETSSAFFLSDFDLGAKAYDLGPYQDLQATIDYFAGSFARISLAAGPGYTASSVLSAIMSDPNQCNAGEFPLACEYRLHRPSFVLVTFGTNDYANSLSAFERYMRIIIDDSIKVGVVPVLATKADNREGNNSINELIAELAHDYDLPLWNFWAAVQSLPDHGLKPDGLHLTFFADHFNDPEAFNYAFPWRNLTALEVLQALQKAVTEE
jgi:hypothetical protein